MAAFLHEGGMEGNRVTEAEEGEPERIKSLRTSGLAETTGTMKVAGKKQPVEDVKEVDWGEARRKRSGGKERSEEDKGRK